MELKTWFLYLITEFLLEIIPGPAVLLVSTQGLKYGYKPSCFGSFGISTGNILYFILCAFGLSAIILVTGNLFEYIKAAGAIYLIVTGLNMIYTSYKKPSIDQVNEIMSQNHYKFFIQGFITQVANPKAIIFFVALLPQFIDTTKNVFIQFTILGLTTIIMETFILMFYGWLASEGQKITGQNTRFRKWQDRISGIVLVGLGINLFLMKRNNI